MCLFDYFVDFVMYFQQFILEIVVYCFVVGQVEQIFILFVGEDIFFMFVWQIVLDFICGEGYDWCYLVYQCFYDMEQCGLIVVMCYVVCFGGVLVVFDDVEVE